jgi:RNA polymerase sigma-54 factor
MALEQRLELRQTVTMSPEAYQGLAILSMPAVELSQLVEAELEGNPVLETDEIDTDPVEGEQASDVGDEEERAWDEWVAEYEELQRLDGVAERDPDRFADSAEDRIAASQTLEDHLLEQIALFDVDEAVARAARVIVGLLDDDGFFTGTLDEVCRMAGVGAGAAAEGLSLVQRLDPPGIGARSLQEALAVQAESLGMRTPLLDAIIERHMESVASGRIRRIARAENVEEEDVYDAVEVLRALNPRPAAAFGAGADVSYVAPDVVVRQFDGEWVVFPDFEVLPMLRISPRYRSMLAGGDNVDEAARRYLKEHVKKAESFIRNLDRRRETVVRIAEVIGETQREFFETGRGPLKPLRLEDVAIELGVHLSTVSRGVTGKYMATPYGMFELKHFFSGGYRTRTGIDVASTSVKQRIRELVHAESPEDPLSDQRIAALLADEGVPVARRTIAKYREEMGIPPSWMRRRHAEGARTRGALL